MNHDTRAALARIFEEWQRRYQADPAAFLADDQAHALEPRTYGEQAAVERDALQERLDTAEREAAVAIKGKG